MTRWLCVLFIAVVILISLLVVPGFTQASASEHRATPVAGLGIIIILVCVLTRHNPIGGWLLWYLIQLVLGFVVSLALFLALTDLSNYLPANWPDKLAYLAFLISSIPVMVLRGAEMFIIIPGSRETARNWSVVTRLKKILWWEVFAAIVATALDAIYWKENLIFDALAIIWPSIWIPYFSLSSRVKRVYGYAPVYPQGENKRTDTGLVTD